MRGKKVVPKGRDVGTTRWKEGTTRREEGRMRKASTTVEVLLDWESKLGEEEPWVST